MEKNAYKLWLIRHTIGIRAGILVFGTVALLWFVVWPITTNVRETQQKILVESVKERELADKVSLLAGIDPQILKDRVEILDKALPPQKDVVLYLSTLDGLSRELGLVFNSISLSPGFVASDSDEATGSAKKATIATKGVQSLGTDIKISGSKEGIYSFLRTVEESLPLMQIKDIKIGRVSNEQYSLSLSLEMLWASFDPKEVTGVITLFNQKEEQYFQKLLTYPQYSSQIGNENFSAPGSMGKNDLFEGVTLQQ